MSGDLHKALLKEAHLRIKEESLTRIIQCLNSLDHDQIWHADHNVLNSVGHLVLHLCGNLRQYLCHGIGGQDDIRDRKIEFNNDLHLRSDVLQRRMTKTIEDGLSCIDRVEPGDWLTLITVQCFDMTKLSALIHAIEHLSYHVGQITYITKQLTQTETGYYEGLDLD